MQPRTLKLYQFGNSVCCQKVRLTLHAKGLEWDPIEVNLFRNEQYDPAYLKLNPAGVVPTLAHDGVVVTESTLICEYLDRVFARPGLMPTDPLEQARVRHWSKLVDEALHEGVGAISFAAMFRERLKALSPEQRAQRHRNVGDPRRHDRSVSLFDHGVDSPFVRYGVAAFEKAFARLEQTIAEGGPWILGSQPTLADIGIAPYVARLHFMGLLDIWIADRPHARAWWDQVQSWPSYRAAIDTPLSANERDEMALHGPRILDALSRVLSELRGAQEGANDGRTVCAA